jgi:hypothetical protein
MMWWTAPTTAIEVPRCGEAILIQALYNVASWLKADIQPP